MASSGYRGAFDVDLSVDNRELVKTLDNLVFEKLVKTNDIRKVFRKVMNPVKKTVQSSAKSAIPNDPRKASQGVRLITLKKGAGAVVGLLDPFKVSSFRLYRKPKGGESGITRKRAISERTRQVEAYYGKDRAFILRFINQGTDARFAGTRGTLKKKAYRGSLTGKKFFRSAEPAMKLAAQNLAKELGTIIEKASKK